MASFLERNSKAINRTSSALLAVICLLMYALLAVLYVSPAEFGIDSFVHPPAAALWSQNLNPSADPVDWTFHGATASIFQTDYSVSLTTGSPYTFANFSTAYINGTSAAIPGSPGSFGSLSTSPGPSDFAVILGGSPAASRLKDSCFA